MRVWRWQYTCGNCGQRYELPGGDLSFLYGVFLGRSRNGEAVILDALADPSYGEVEAAVLADRRMAGATDADIGSIVGYVLGKVLDGDSRGDPYVFSGVPGCPACGSTDVADFVETQEPWPSEAVAVGHIRWDRLDSPTKTEKVRAVLDELRHRSA